MQLKIIVKRAHCTKHRTKKYIIDVESLDKNIVECCKKAIGEYNTICFSKYYSNCDLMNFRGKFPYIIRDGKCVWKEPYEKVTIKEFFETHNLTEKNSIYVDVDAFGGAGDFYDILTWVVDMWPMIEPYVETSGNVIGAIDLVIRCVKALGKRIKDSPSSIDVKDFVQSKREWTIEELGHKSNIQDDTILRLLLTHFGYEQHEDVYRYDEKLKIKYERKLSKSENEYNAPIG